MDEQEDLPKDMLEQVGNVSRPLCGCLMLRQQCAKCLGPKCSFECAGPQIIYQPRVEKPPGGLEQQESSSVVASVVGAAWPPCAIPVPRSALGPQGGTISPFCGCSLRFVLNGCLFLKG